MTYREAIQEGLNQIKNGQSILCPTDTIWGLSCDAKNEDAVAQLFELKQREPNKSFIVLVNSTAMVNNLVKDIPGVVWDLLDLSTSPLSIIMDGAQGIAKNAIHSNGSIAFRWVKTGYCFDLLQKLRRPIISTSPNFSGDPTPLKFNDINKEIISKVAFSVPEQFASDLSGRPSKIIKIQSNGVVEIIRK